MLKTRFINNHKPQTLLYLPGFATNAELLPKIDNWNIIYFDGFLNTFYDLPPLYDILNEYHLHNIAILGWSLGAKIAVEMANRYPKSVRQLFLLSLNPQFNCEILSAFENGLKSNLEHGLKKFYTETFHPNKDAARKFIRSDIYKKYLDSLTYHILSEGIKTLGEDTVVKNTALFPSTIIFHGTDDVITPFKSSFRWAKKNHLLFTSVNGAGHYLLEHAEVLNEIDKPFHYFKQFDKDSYDKVSTVQHKSARKLQSLLPDFCKNILEIGSGSGLYTKILSKKYTNSQLKAIDIFMETKVLGADFYLLNAEKDFPHTTNNPYDLITANAAIHWFNLPEIFFSNCYKNLSSNGTLLYSYYTKNCYKELQIVLKEALGNDFSITAETFLDIEQILAIQKSAFHGDNKLTVISETITLEHKNLHELFNVISKSGTKGQREDDISIWTPGLFKKIEKIFLGKYGKIISSFEVFYIRQNKI